MLVDRVAADGHFHPVHTGIPIEQQFPLQCDITGALLGAYRVKVLLANARIYLVDGHHEPAPLNRARTFSVFNSVPSDRPIAAKPLYGGVTMHYKWVAGVDEYLRGRVEGGRVDPRESQTFLDYLQENNAINTTRFCESFRNE
eukprot:TRINITY_DN6979_c0_g1_i1.p1 TRINITY_DN6979_c0_g1~~TRINITY_DN6979_c0_g1_i1.p1  ORF type:complete len:143 (+),score=6.10 TRINITY_DN6979_c0_g1_i1:209-637(+)